MTATGSLTLLIWLDSTVNPEPVIAAAVDRRPISPESALARLFPDGLAGLAQYLPWVRPAALECPACAYAVVTHEPACVRSGFVAHPHRADIDRLSAEFLAIATEESSEAIVRAFDPVRSPVTPTAGIDIRLFGGNVVRGHRDISLSNGEFAVLAALALGQETLRFDEWCDRLWPDRDAESAARLLRVYIHRIRTKCGDDDVIETHDGGYRIGSGTTVDVIRIEGLARRSTPESADIDDDAFAAMQRAFDGFKDRRYRRLACLAPFPEIERRLVAAGAELARFLTHRAFLKGDHERVLAIADQLVAVDPYDEVAAELHIRAQLRLGRPDAATRYFRTFCRVLRDELDLSPPQHLARLIHA